MTVRVKREKEPQIEYYGAASGELLGSSAGVRTSVTITPTDDYLIIVPKNSVGKAQVELGSFATSYIPTTTAEATRAADIASIDTANFGYNQDAGTVVVEASMLSDSAGISSLTQAYFCFHDGTSDNRFEVYSDVPNTLALKDRVSGVNNTVNISSSADLTADNKLAASYTVGDVSSAVVNGGSVVTTASTNNTAYTTLILGDTQNVLAELNGHIKSIKYYPRRLTNEQLQELTS